MRRIRHLEIHAAHACNLACESCSHYSNHGHKGIVEIATAREWMAPWSRRISPQLFSVLGGEPTIHPDLTGFLVMSREMFPEAHLRIVTNGFFLHRHPDLPRFMRDDRRTELYLSIHHDAPEYREKLVPVAALLSEWMRTYGILVQNYPSQGTWTRRYKGEGATMEPFEDSDPRRSWEECRAKYCPQLFEGSIWKCAPLAYLPMQHERFGLSQKWSRYLEYRPLDPACSDAELDEYIRREEEPYCAMCPSRPEHFKLPNPIRIHRKDRPDADHA